jgi:hypothetical protein
MEPALAPAAVIVPGVPGILSEADLEGDMTGAEPELPGARPEDYNTPAVVEVGGQRRPRADGETYALLLDAAARRGLADSTAAVLDAMEIAGFAGSESLYMTALRGASAAMGAVDGGDDDAAMVAVLSLVDRAERAGVDIASAAFSELLAGCEQRSDPKTSFAILRAMHDRDVAVQPSQHSSVIRACAAAGELDTAVRHYESLGAASAELKPSVSRALIDSAASAGDAKLARHVLDTMPTRGLSPDVLCFNALISAVPGSACREILSLMADAGVPPNAGTHITVVESLTRDGDAAGLDDAFALYESAMGRSASNKTPAVAVTNALIDACFRCGCPGRGMALFEGTTERDAGTHAAMIRGLVGAGRSCGSCGAAAAAQASASASASAPAPAAAQQQCDACGAALVGGYGAAAAHFASMLAEGRIAPGAEAYLPLLAAAPTPMEVLKWVADMDARGVPATRGTYAALLKALLASGRVDLARNVYEKGCAEGVYADLHSRVFHLRLTRCSDAEARLAVLRHIEVVREHVAGGGALKDFDIRDIDEAIFDRFRDFLEDDLLVNCEILSPGTLGIAEDQLRALVDASVDPGAVAGKLTEGMLGEGARERSRRELLASPAGVGAAPGDQLSTLVADGGFSLDGGEEAKVRQCLRLEGVLFGY